MIVVHTKSSTLLLFFNLEFRTIWQTLTISLLLFSLLLLTDGAGKMILQPKTFRFKTFIFSTFN